MSRRLSEVEWEQVKTAHAAGAGLRELARKMGIPQGTMLARASREHWTGRIEAAKSLAHPKERAIISTCDAAALTMRDRAERHAERMAGITDRVLPHLARMEPGEILNSARNLERFDFVARRNYRLDDAPSTVGCVNIAIMANQAAIDLGPA